MVELKKVKLQKPTYDSSNYNKNNSLSVNASLTSNSIIDTVEDFVDNMVYDLSFDHSLLTPQLFTVKGLVGKGAKLYYDSSGNAIVDYTDGGRKYGKIYTVDKNGVVRKIESYLETETDLNESNIDYAHIIEEYDEHGNLIKVSYSDYKWSSSEVTEEIYYNPDTGKPKKRIKRYEDRKIQYTYDEDGNMFYSKETYNDGIWISISYNEDNDITKVAYGDGNGVIGECYDETIWNDITYEYVLDIIRNNKSY